MIKTTVSTQIIAILENAPTGLTGTVGVEIVDNDNDSIAIAYTTDGIVEYPNGSGTYQYTFVTPGTGGNYLIVWGINTPLTPENTFSEELILTNPNSPAVATGGFTAGWDKWGDPNTPQEIVRLRKQSSDMTRRMGQPVIARHMWNRDDVNNNLAKPCPACYDGSYDQVRHDCLICFGQGFVSTENEITGGVYIDSNGQRTTDPSSGVRAPRYGGFDQPYLVWLIEPDVIEDEFKINEQGVLVRTYDATGIAPWFPKLGDNDLCINVLLDQTGYNVSTPGDRFQLKMVQQITVRGLGSIAKPTTGNQVYLVNQKFRMNKLPLESVLYSVPIDPDTQAVPD